MDVQEFIRWISTLFQLSKVSSHTQGMDSDYSVPPAPLSLEHDQFLPVSNTTFGRQDYHMRQLQKTFAYTKALQYWVEKAQHHLQAGLPNGGECAQGLEGHGALYHIYQCRGCPALALG